MPEIIFPKIVEAPVMTYADLSLLHGSVEANVTQQVRNYKALVDANSGRVFSIVHKHYKLVRHEDFLNMVESALQAFPEMGPWERNVRMLQNGKRMWATYRFPELETNPTKGTRKFVPDDIVNPTIEIFNPYDVGWSRAVTFGAYRVRCKNGALIAIKLLRFIRTHLQKVSSEMITPLIERQAEIFATQSLVWNSWATRIVTPREFEEIMGSIPFNQREMVEVGSEVEVTSDIQLHNIRLKTLTFWLFYNILSQYITHKVSSDLRKIQLYQALNQSFYRRG